MGNNLQPDVWLSTLITWALATLTFGLRFWARRITGVSLSWDDWFLIIAYFFAVVFNIGTLAWISAGLGLHIADVPGNTAATLRTGAIHLFVAELTYASALACVKFSILSFYWRVFSTSPIRVPIIVLFVLSGLWLTIRTFMSIFHCVPVHALWDGVENVPGAVCNINGSMFFVASTSTHFGLDILIMALPIFQIGQLQLRRAQRIGVSILFTFGVLVCIASIFLVVHAVNLNPKTEDFTYDIAYIIIWAAVEVNLAVFSTCLPLLRPIYIKMANYFHLGSSFHASSITAGTAGDYQNSRPKSFIRLGGSSHLGRSKLSDQTGSTCDLAMVPAKPLQSARGMNRHDAHHGRAQVTITGTQLGSDEELQRWDTVQGQSRADSRNLTRSGIVVRNDTSVEISLRTQP